MMKYIKLLTLSAFTAACFVGSAQAKLKFDISESLGQVQETVSQYAKTAQEKLEEIMAIKNKNLLGDGSEATLSISSIKSAVKGVTDEADKVRTELNNYKSDFNSYYNEAMAVKESVTGEGGIGNVKDNLKNALSDSETHAQNVYQMLNLQNEKKSLEGDYKRKIEAENARYQGELSSLNNNISVKKQQLSGTSDAAQRKAIEKQISDLEDQKIIMFEVHNKKKGEIQKEYLASYATVNSGINDLNAVFTSNLTKSKAEKSKSIFDSSGKGSKELLAEAAEKFYLKPNQVPNTSSIGEIRNSREDEALRDNLELVVKSLKARMRLLEVRETAAQIAANVGVQEGANAATSVSTELTAQNIDSTLDRIELELWLLRAQSAYDLVNSSEYQMAEVAETSDISTLNLCEYKYKEPEPVKTTSDVKNDLDSLKGLLGVR